MKMIFLIHDHQDNPWHRKQQIESSGFRVEMFTRGEDAIAVLDDYKPDLLLMDVLLDGPNGFEVCRKIRETHGADKLPIILCSTIYRDIRFQTEAHMAGAQDYFLRPIEISELVAKMIRHTGSFGQKNGTATPSSSADSASQRNGKAEETELEASLSS